MFVFFGFWNDILGNVPSSRVVGIFKIEEALPGARLSKLELDTFNNLVVLTSRDGAPIYSIL